MPRIRLELRRRRLAAKGDRGAGAVEYLGAILLVSLVIGSLLMVATPVGNTIAAKLCEAVGTTCGSTSDADTDGTLTQKAEPEYACVVSNEGTQISGNLQILFVTLDSGGELLVEQLSDGTHRVTVSGDTSAGLSGPQERSPANSQSTIMASL